jgi:hypothetical protein
MHKTNISTFSPHNNLRIVDPRVASHIRPRSSWTCATASSRRLALSSAASFQQQNCNKQVISLVIPLQAQCTAWLSISLLPWNFTFQLWAVLLIIILFCTFSRINLFSFYLFFESRLIPTAFLILGWGYQPEHLQAGIYLLFLHVISVSSYIGGYFLCL